MINGPLQAFAKAAEAQPKLAKLDKAAKGVESLFMKDLLSAMRRGMPKTAFGNGLGSQMYRDMFDQALAESLSQSGSLGIGKILYRQLAKQVARQGSGAGVQGTGLEDGKKV